MRKEIDRNREKFEALKRFAMQKKISIPQELNQYWIMIYKITTLTFSYNFVFFFKKTSKYNTRNFSTMYIYYKKYYITYYE